MAKEGDKVKTIRFGEQGAKTAGKPKKGESEAMKKKRKSFKSRHGKEYRQGQDVGGVLGKQGEMVGTIYEGYSISYCSTFLNVQFSSHCRYV